MENRRKQHVEYHGHTSPGIGAPGAFFVAMCRSAIVLKIVVDML